MLNRQQALNVWNHVIWDWINQFVFFASSIQKISAWNGNQTNCVNHCSIGRTYRQTVKEETCIIRTGSENDIYCGRTVELYTLKPFTRSCEAIQVWTVAQVGVVPFIQGIHPSAIMAL